MSWSYFHRYKATDHQHIVALINEEGRQEGTIASFMRRKYHIFTPKLNAVKSSEVCVNRGSLQLNPTFSDKQCQAVRQYGCARMSVCVRAHVCVQCMIWSRVAAVAS